jgi:DNA polymerase II
MDEYTGWLFDLYEHPEKGLVLWIVGEDGRPHSFHQNFPVAFCAGGTTQQLHDLGEFLRSKYSSQLLKLTRHQMEDLFDGLQDVMGMRVENTMLLQQVFREASLKFPDLNYSNVDIPISMRYAARHNVFMMARCRVVAQPDGKLVNIQALDKPEDLNPKLPELRVLRLRPDINPNQKKPRHLFIRYNDVYIRAPLSRPKELINLLNNIFFTFDPDVIETQFGDAWFFSYLEKASKHTGISINPNRDPVLRPRKVKEISFYNYGRAHYRGPQIHLYGRWHVDKENCMTYKQYGLAGAIEQTRWSSLPLQGVARRSPGAAMAAMQELTALRRNVLIPYQRQKGEISKTYEELVEADSGGFVKRPKPGVHSNVAVLDFASLMASIIIHWNVSPETVVSIDSEEEGFEMPELGVKILSKPGLIPETLRSMRDKRIQLKRWLRTLPRDTAPYLHAHRTFEPVVDGLKWLTVVCYGRLGFANSRFGRVNAHEVVSYLSRKVIMETMGIAEEQGYEWLHVYVDSVFITRKDAAPADFQAFAEQIESQIQLPMDLENVYSWFAFPASRESENRSVANRFFGRAADGGKHKIRGLALRRGDTPEFISKIQMGVFKILSKESNVDRLPELFPQILEYVGRKLALLVNKEVPVRQLIVTQTVSRELNGYSVLSPVVVAARQLLAHGKTLKMGNTVRFIHVNHGHVIAADLPLEVDIRTIDVRQYKELILKGVHDLLQPLGVSERTLRDWLFSKAGYISPPGILSSTDKTRLALPLFNNIKRLRVDIQ